jgi:peptidase M1-like protein
MNHFLVGLLLLGARASTTAATRDSLPIELARLSLDLRLDYSRGALAGSATLVLRNRGRRPITEVPLLLNRLMMVRGVSDGRGRPLSYRQRIAVFRDDSLLQVNTISVLPRPLRVQDSLTLVIRYDGFLVGYAETGSLYIRDRIAAEFTILREDAFAFPVLGVPSWEVNRTIPREPFSFSARVTVPVGETVATGGVLDSVARRDTLATWSYSSPGAVPFLNIAIAPYQRLADNAYTIFHFPADSSGARSLGTAVASALERLRTWYGDLPNAPQLVIMEIPEGMGSQASLTGGIIQTADAFRSRSELPQVYHELSHLWNAPDLDRPSSRWDEGLASYLQWRLAAELDGWNDWTGRLDRVVQRLIRQCAMPAPCRTTPFVAYGRSGATDHSYSVGLLMFYALSRTMGEERFDRAYREYFQEHRSAGGSLDELVAAFERADPATGTIFHEWLTTTRWYDRLSNGEAFEAIVRSYSVMDR